MADNIELKVVDINKEDCRMLLSCWREYWSSETLRSAIPEFTMDSNRENLEEMLEKMFNGMNSPLVVAFDKDKEKVAGYVMCQKKHRNIDNKEQVPGATGNVSDFEWKDVSQKQLDGFTNFAGKMAQVDILEKYEVDKASRILQLSVAKEYGKRQLGYRLINKALDVLREQGVSVVYSYFSSSFSQRVGTKCGFEIIEEFDYEKTFDLFTEIPEEIIKYHKSCLVMARKL